MDDKHRLFLQFLMTIRIAKATDVRNFFEKHCMIAGSSQIQNEHIVRFVSVLNSHLRPLQMEIKKGFIEENGQSFFALINQMDSSITRLSSDYTVRELEVFKKVLVLILENQDGEVSSSLVLNATEELEHRISKSEAENIIEKFIDNDILKNTNGVISLSSFCLLELDTFLRTHYQDFIKFCHLCKNIVLKGITCENCQEKFHKHCVSTFSKSKSNINCPKCNTLLKDTQSNTDDSTPLNRKRLRRN